MRRQPICIDIDNTIAATDFVLRRLIRECTEGRVNLLHNDVVRYEYPKCTDSQGNHLRPREWEKVVSTFHREGVCEIQPIRGVAGTLGQLRKVFEIHLATSRDSMSAGLTEGWLREHRIPHDYLHFALPGQKHTLPIRFAYAIEDDREQALAFHSVGVPAIVLAQPWNRLRAESPIERLPNWKAIASRLMEERQGSHPTVSGPPGSRFILSPDSLRS